MGQRCPSRSVELSLTSGEIIGEEELVFHSVGVEVLLESMPSDNDLVDGHTFLMKLLERWLVF